MGGEDCTFLALGSSMFCFWLVVFFSVDYILWLVVAPSA